MKKLIKKVVPTQAILFYHYALALLASFVYGNPSKKMVVIGVTGTKGKTTTTTLIAHLIEAAGHKVGLTTSAQFKVGDKTWINDTKMTMQGRFKLQKLMRDMVRSGVTHAVIETSSEGIMQHRHRGVRYDAAVYTNVSPEHIEAHGTYTKYKKTKFNFVKRVALSKEKTIKGKKVKKALVISTDNEELKKLLRLPFASRVVVDVGVKHDVDLNALPNSRTLKPSNIKPTGEGTGFNLGSSEIDLPLLGTFNAYNATLALAVGEWLDIPRAQLIRSLKSIEGVPGRMEIIDEGQDFSVIVDYAHEPKSVEAAYETVRAMADARASGITHEPAPRVICVTGSAGGGRDKKRRPVLGKLAAKYCDFVIVTNEDPYDEDPDAIIDAVAEGVEEGGKLLNNNYWKIETRQKGVEKALSLAAAKDVVIMTGKGAEQVIMGKNGTRHPWDDREVSREILRKLRG